VIEVAEHLLNVPSVGNRVVDNERSRILGYRFFEAIGYGPCNAARDGLSQHCTGLPVNLDDDGGTGSADFDHGVAACVEYCSTSSRCLAEAVSDRTSFNERELPDFDIVNLEQYRIVERRNVKPGHGELAEARAPGMID
jgi:hypothetical protein